MRSWPAPGRWLGRVGAALLGLALLAYLGLAVWVAAYSFLRDDQKSDAAVVLGAAAWGSRPSPVLEERVKHALALYRGGVVRKVLFTGGVGRGDIRAEGVVARAYALRQGLPGSDGLCEGISHNTGENVAAARAVLQRAGLARVLLVSDPIHMLRAVTLARAAGLDAHPNPTPSTRFVSWHSRLRFLAREAFYLAGYYLRLPFVSDDDAAGVPLDVPPC